MSTNQNTNPDDRMMQRVAVPAFMRKLAAAGIPITNDDELNSAIQLGDRLMAAEMAAPKVKKANVFDRANAALDQLAARDPAAAAVLNPGDQRAKMAADAAWTGALLHDDDIFGAALAVAAGEAAALRGQLNGGV